ncbi:hypothetical protein CO251_02480 [Sulfobacillus sp. hq2]|nr:hypothetical protein CO251_02480 [Sulfobacillus sp. hq2]
MSPIHPRITTTGSRDKAWCLPQQGRGAQETAQKTFWSAVYKKESNAMVVRRGKSRSRGRFQTDLANARLHMLLKACPDPVLIKDAEGFWYRMNQAAQRLFAIHSPQSSKLSPEEARHRYPHLAESFVCNRQEDEHAWQAHQTLSEQVVFWGPEQTPQRLQVQRTPYYYPDGSRWCLVITAAPAASPPSQGSLHQSLFELEMIMEATDTAVWQFDAGQHLLRANHIAWHWMGYPASTPPEVPNTCLLFQSNPWQIGFQEVLRSQQTTRTSIETWPLASGALLEVEVDRIPYRHGSTLAGIVVLARDITAYRETARALADSEERYRTILNEIQDGYFEVDLAGNLRFFNPALSTILGFTAQELAGLNYRAYTNEDQAQLLYQSFHSVYRSRHSAMTEWQIIRKDGTPRYVNATVSLILNADDQPAGFRGLVRDITDHKQAELELRYLAHHDPLTALPNRSQFIAEIQSAIAESQDHQQSFALLFVDLDRFKNVNDTLGHPAGDQLLQQVADTLKKIIRQKDMVARTGGDEFAVLLRPMTRAEDLSAIAARILEQLQKPWHIAGQEFRCPGSIGIALYPHDGSDPDTLLKHADVAMYRAKNLGGNRFVLYNATMNRQSSDYVLLESDLNQALKQRQFILHYQPQMNSQTGQIYGVEALVRWQRPNGSLVPPNDFIPFAEHSGLIIPIGQQVFAEACRQTAQWQAKGRPLHKVAINLSARQFQQPDLQAMIMQILETTGCPPQAVEIEITESAAMENVAYTLRILKAFRDMGMSIALDDFGTGFSSLRYLKEFPITSLKIDQSFVHDVLYETKSRAIVKTVIELANNLGVAVIAEGAETQEQVNALQDLGCSVIQGYYFSRPLPADALEHFMNRYR